jgi:hypothetical protein
MGSFLQLKMETVYLAVNYLDRFLDKSIVAIKHLQLVAVCALLLAAKYEEVFPPTMETLLYVCKDAYTRIEVINMEACVIKTLVQLPFIDY